MQKLWITTLAAALCCSLLMTVSTAYSAPSPHQIVDSLTRENEVYFNQRPPVRHEPVAAIGLSGEAALNIARQRVDPKQAAQATPANGRAVLANKEVAQESIFTRVIRVLPHQKINPLETRSRLEPLFFNNTRHTEQFVAVTPAINVLPNRAEAKVVAAPVATQEKRFFVVTKVVVPQAEKKALHTYAESEESWNQITSMNDQAILKKEVDQWIMDEINGPAVQSSTHDEPAVKLTKNVIVFHARKINRQSQQVQSAQHIAGSQKEISSAEQQEVEKEVAQLIELPRPSKKIQTSHISDSVKKDQDKEMVATLLNLRHL